MMSLVITQNNLRRVRKYTALLLRPEAISNRKLILNYTCAVHRHRHTPNYSHCCSFEDFLTLSMPYSFLLIKTTCKQDTAGNKRRIKLLKINKQM
jgi:hypothetical protein